MKHTCTVIHTVDTLYSRSETTTQVAEKNELESILQRCIHADTYTYIHTYIHTYIQYYIKIVHIYTYIHTSASGWCLQSPATRPAASTTSSWPGRWRILCSPKYLFIWYVCMCELYVTVPLSYPSMLNCLCVLVCVHYWSMACYWW